MAEITTRHVVRCDSPFCSNEFESAHLPRHRGGVLGILHLMRGWGAVTVHRPRPTSRDRLEGAPDRVMVMCPEHWAPVAGTLGLDVRGPAEIQIDSDGIPQVPLSWRGTHSRLSVKEGDPEG